jgi:DMSO/TMAO reductase YedYZ molybdopterin-dependent catalytic subunit
MRRWLAALMLVAALPAFAQERASAVSTQVRISGEVQRELTLGVDELRLAASRRSVVQERGYGGIRLTDLLQEADIRQDARHALRRTYIVATATDGFQAVFSWGELFNTPIGRGVIVAYERDGAPLRDGEGRIALVSLADERPGTCHVKWLSRIEVRRVSE